MSALTTREALAKALQDIADARCRHHGPDYGGCVDSQCSPMVEEMVDALIAAGAVVDAATLADDDELVSNLDSRPMWSGPGDYGTRDALEALAAALTERGA